jgi:PAS domain S-box-containing protein
VRSLEKQLPLAAFVLLTSVAASVTFAAYRDARSTADALYSERLLRLSDQLAGSIGTSVARALESAVAAASDPAIVRAVGAPDASRSDSAGAALVRRFPTLPANVAAGVWDLSGDLVASAGDPGVVGWMPRPPLVDEPTVTPVLAQDDTVVHYGMVAPVRDGRRLVGFVQLRQRLTVGGTQGQVEAVLGATGRILIGSTGGAWTDFAMRVDPPSAAAVGAAEALEYERGGERVFGLGRPIGSTGLMVVTEVSEGAVLSSTRTFVTRIGLLAALFVAVATAAAWLLGRRLTGPLGRLRVEAEALGRGEYHTRVPEQGHPEIVEVARAFNKMAEDTQGHVAALQSSEQRFRSLVTATAQIVWWTDADGDVVEPIPSWEAYTGQPPDGTMGAGWTAALHPEDGGKAVIAWKEAVRAGKLFETEYRIRGRTGDYRWFQVRAVPITIAGEIGEWVITCSDVTEQRDARAKLETKELELQRSQRLDAVGRLAGGIAHDFNNLLAAILGPAEMASLELPDGHPVREDLRDIGSAARRAADLTRKLLAFGRQQVMTPVILDVNEAIETAGSLLKRVIGERVRLHVSPLAKHPTIKVDRTQFEQIIVNLSVNARDAMPNGGSLTIETSNIEVDSELIEVHGGLRLGRQVVVAVSDTGTGMDPETQKRIFEPFFTTKSPDRGTGLGLSTVYGIVKQSGGEIVVYSEPGRGTAFKIYFPVASGDVAPQEQAVSEEPLPRGTETILLAEDEDVVRRLAVRILTSMGYTVLHAPSAVAALKLAVSHPGPIDLLLSDLVMADMDGVELWEELKARREGIPVLFMSGWASDAVVKHGLLEGRIPFLQKPFSARQLGLKIREILVTADDPSAP